MIEIVGDGFAGTCLAEHLSPHVDCVVVGDGKQNAPVYALVHLFTGRSFDKSALEVDAFRYAIDYWSGNECADRREVRRHVASGTRLRKSVTNCSVPDEFKPDLRGDWAHYSPGFVVRAQQWIDLLCDRHRRASPGSSNMRVFAGGSRISEHVKLPWMLQSSQASTETTSDVERAIVIANGRQRVVVDGQLSTGGKLDREESTRPGVDVWSGEKCALNGDRFPVIGWVGDDFVFAGFGSRGFFWIPYCAKIATEAIVNGAAIPEPIDVARLPIQPSLANSR